MRRGKGEEPTLQSGGTDINWHLICDINAYYTWISEATRLHLFVLFVQVAMVCLTLLEYVDRHPGSSFQFFLDLERLN